MLAVIQGSIEAGNTEAVRHGVDGFETLLILVGSKIVQVFQRILPSRRLGNPLAFKTHSSTG